MSEVASHLSSPIDICLRIIGEPFRTAGATSASGHTGTIIPNSTTTPSAQHRAPRRRALPIPRGRWGPAPSAMGKAEYTIPVMNTIQGISDQFSYSILGEKKVQYVTYTTPAFCLFEWPKRQKARSRKLESYIEN